MKAVKELEEVIDTLIINESSKQTVPAPPEAAAASSKASNSEIVCEGEICYKKPKEPETAEPSRVQSAPTSETEAEKQEKIKKAMKLIEEKRIEKIKEEQRLEKEQEVQRRKEGQELQNLKKWQGDQEMKQIKEERLREKTEAKAARQRVLDQIEQDKKERAQRFSAQTTPTEPKATPVTPPATPVSTADTARIQFKKPDGLSEIVTFDSSMLFSDLHLFVKNDVLHGSMNDFTLATTFPRRVFSQLDFDKTLADLNLAPSSVLLILPKIAAGKSSGPSSVLPTQTDGSLFSMLGALVMGLFSPVMALVAYLRNFVMRTPEAGESPNEAGKRKRNEELLAPNDA